MWSSPFQCEWCWIVNLKKRDAMENDPKDNLLLSYLRRMNLDMMWSREPNTVKGTLSQLIKGSKLSLELGLEPVDIARGPWPVGDLYGAQVALEILKASQMEGRHVKTHQQFETIRQIRSGFSNAFECGPAGINKDNIMFRAEKGRVYGLKAAPTESLLFERFMQGLGSRMGKLVIPNQAVDNQQFRALLELMERDLADPSLAWSKKRKAIMLGSFLALCYGCSLRGHEGLYLERTELLKVIDMGKDGVVDEEGGSSCNGYVCAPLMGRFKNEKGEQKHVCVMVNISKSKINFRLWMERLCLVLRQESKFNKEAGPAFCEIDGDMITSHQMNTWFIEVMERLKEERPELFPEGADLVKLYGISRSLRRGSNSRATEEGVPKDILDLVNRWSSFEAKRGQRPTMSMAHHYLQMRMILKRILKYSEAL